MSNHTGISSAEKVERVKAIVKQILDLEAELIAIVIDQRTEIRIEGKPVDVQIKKISYKKVKSKKVKKVAGQKTCGICGKPGHFKKTCPDREVEAGAEDESIDDGRLERVQWQSVRDCKHKEMTVDETSNDLELDRDEVAFAYSSVSYEGYLKLR